MNKYIIILFLLLLALVSLGQEYNLIVDEKLTGNADFKAQGRITLKSGFNSNGYDFTAETGIEVTFEEKDFTAAVPTTGTNYIITTVLRKPLDEDALETELGGSGTLAKRKDIVETVQYFDGLGRALQTVAVNSSPMGNDIITPFVYDEVGRQHKQYLPFTEKGTTTANNGALISDLFSADGSENTITEYYQNMDLNSSSITNSAYMFSETVFDGSPLNRVMKQGAPGADWQPDGSDILRTASDHVVSFEYATNPGNSLSIWKVDSEGKLIRSGKYAAGTLYCTVTADENNTAGSDEEHMVWEYKDFEGKVILKQSKINKGSYYENVKTYYVYDDFGLLRYVLPPASKSSYADLTETDKVDITTSWVSELCYYYEYDAKKRMTLKKLPGAEPVYMFYDNRDRLVLTQDGNQRRNNYYNYTKYDHLNRPCLTGQVKITLNSGKTISDLRTQANNYIKFQAGTVNTSTDYSEKIGDLSGINVSYYKVYTKTYYDSYSYPGCHAFLLPTGAVEKLGYTPAKETRVKGMVTGMKNRVSSEDAEIITMYYDEYGREIWRKRSLDYGMGTAGELVISKYLFSGELEQTYQKVSFNENETLVSKYMEYDHRGRLLEVSMEVNGTTHKLASYTYDEMGQVNAKTYGSGLENTQFQYNARGWLTTMNNARLKLNKSLYSQILAYDYNGNINTMQWQVPLQGSGLLRETFKYTFNYDVLNRLRSANYYTGKAVGEILGLPNNFYINAWDESNDFRLENISYDVNGNITSLIRQGINATGTMDDLAYSYSGNQLIKVVDSGDKTTGFIDNSTSSADYQYDNNGNMVYDANKDLHFSYNNLNLLSAAKKDNGEGLLLESVNYKYTATGEKIGKENYSMMGQSATYRYYFSNFEYNTDKELEYIHTEEGRFRLENGNYIHDFYLKDHLGNTRVVFTDDATNAGTPEVLQVNNYYPFGMRWGQGATFENGAKGNNQYLYNGKELQEDMGLDWYDYGARMYDAALGRFHTVDPLAEQGFRLSPYNYTNNNPIRYIDPDGQWFWEKKNVRAARKYRRKHGGTFKKWKGKNGKRYASVDGPNGSGVTSKVFAPTSNKKNTANTTNKRGFIIWGNAKSNSRSVAPYSTKDPIGTITLDEIQNIFNPFMSPKPKTFKPKTSPSGSEANDRALKELGGNLDTFVPETASPNTSDVEINSETGNNTNSRGEDTTISISVKKSGPFNKYRYLDQKDTTVKKSDWRKVRKMDQQRVLDFQK
jgi:RHS repeat-associated protein